MSIKTTWIDPETGKEYSYGFGYDIEKGGMSIRQTLAKKFEEFAECEGLRIYYTLSPVTKTTKFRFASPQTPGYEYSTIIYWESVTDMRDTYMNVSATVKRKFKEEFSRRVRDGEISIDSMYPSTLFMSKDAEIDFWKEQCNKRYGRSSALSIEKVIFNDPATIVYWSDDTKTIVKCQDEDEFDPEKGLAMAISKKFFGNKGSYCDVIKKWTDKYWEAENSKLHAHLSEILPVLIAKHKKSVNNTLCKYFGDNETKADD